jgi:hypothetical protein
VAAAWKPGLPRSRTTAMDGNQTKEVRIAGAGDFRKTETQGELLNQNLGWQHPECGAWASRLGTT